MSGGLFLEQFQGHTQGRDDTRVGGRWHDHCSCPMNCIKWYEAFAISSRVELRWRWRASSGSSYDERRDACELRAQMGMESLGAHVPISSAWAPGRQVDRPFRTE